MEGNYGAARPRERPASRADSLASTNDARRSSNRSRNSSILPYSTRSDGSTFYYGEISTLSRAVLHTGEDDDDEAGDTIRETRPGWHRHRHSGGGEDGASERDGDEQYDAEEEEDDDGEVGYEDEDGDDAEGHSRRSDRSQRHRRPRDASARSVSFHLTPFRSENDFDSFSVDDRSASSCAPRSPQRGGANGSISSRRSRGHFSQGELPSISHVSSSFPGYEDSSYSTVNSRFGRQGTRPFATLQDSLHVGEGRRRGHDAHDLPPSPSSVAASSSVAAAAVSGSLRGTGSGGRVDDAAPQRRVGTLPRPPALGASGSLGAASRLNLHSGGYSERGVNALSPTSVTAAGFGGGGGNTGSGTGGVPASPSSRQRRSTALAKKAGELVDGATSPSMKRNYSGGDGLGANSKAADATPGFQFAVPFTAYSSSSGVRDAHAEALPSVAAALAAEDRVWPYTQVLDVRLIMAGVRKQIEWNHMMRQLLLLIPLLFLVGFLAGYNASAIQTNFLVTESQRQIFARTPFPSAATALERYRQQKTLGMQVNVPTDRLFADIHTQTDWIDYFCDVLLPGIFPRVVDNAYVELLKPKECLGTVTVTDGLSSSSNDDCFEDGIFWWDRPGCSASDSYEGFALAQKTSAVKPQTVAESRRKAAPRAVPAAASNTFAGEMSSRRSSKSSVDTTVAAYSKATPTSSVDSTDGSSSSGDSDPCSPENYVYNRVPRVGPAQNYYLGALRVRTIRMRPHSATLQTHLYPRSPRAFPTDAWSAHHSRRDEETTPTRCPSITLQNVTTNETTPLYVYRAPEANDPYCVATAGRFGSYHCGGYTFDVPFRASSWLASRYWLAVRNNSCFFVDNWATRLAVIEFFTYTPDHDMFHMVKLRAEVLAGGSYHAGSVYRSFRVWTPARTGELVYVTFTFVYGIFYGVFLFVRLRWQVQFFGWRDALKDVSAWMDVCMMTSLIISVAFYYAWARLSARVSDKVAFPMVSDVYPSYLDAVQAAYERISVAVAFCVLLCFTRLFFFRTLLRPLNTFVTALSLSMPTLVATAVLFFIILLGYALAAYAVFGSSCEFYTSFGSALYAVLSYWYAVSFLIPNEREVARQFTSLFFWSLTVVLLSLSIAIYNAIVSHSFARIQAVYGVTYDEVWIVRCAKAFGDCCTWPRFKRFAAKMVRVQRESENLLTLLVQMDELYFGRDEKADKRSSNRNRSSSSSSGDGTSNEDDADLCDPADEVDGQERGAIRQKNSPFTRPSSQRRSSLSLSQLAESHTATISTTTKGGMLPPGRQLSSSTTSPTSLIGKARRLASVVEGQAYDPTASASISTPQLAREQRAARPHIGSASQANTSSSLTQNTSNETSAAARRLAAVSFSAVETQNPLAPTTSSFLSAKSDWKHNYRADKNSAARKEGNNRPTTLKGKRKYSAVDFRNQVRRTSDELREIYDDLRQLTLAHAHIDFFAWCEIIPLDIFTECGGIDFFKECWREMAEAQADVSLTPQQQARREFRGKVALATEREVAGGIVGIGHLENTLTQLELHVDSLLQNVSKR